MSSLLPHAWEVPPVFRSRLGQRAGRQRIMIADGHLLIILHKVPKPGEPERESVFFWRNPAGDWIATESGSGLGALHQYFEQWRKVVDDLEDQMQTVSARNCFNVLQQSTPMLRVMRNAHSTLQEAREANPDRAILIARDEAVEMERALELLHSDAKNGMEYMIARQGEEQSQRAHQLVRAGHRLNLMIALFLPLTAIGSAFGMNLPHGMENLRSSAAFWTLLVIGLLTGLMLVGMIMANLDAWTARKPQQRKPRLPK